MLSVQASERALLCYLIGRLNSLDPDVLVGHNVSAFDLDILLHRLQHHKVGHVLVAAMTHSCHNMVAQLGHRCCWTQTILWPFDWVYDVRWDDCLLRQLLPMLAGFFGAFRHDRYLHAFPIAQSAFCKHCANTLGVQLCVQSNCSYFG